MTERLVAEFAVENTAYHFDAQYSYLVSQGSESCALPGCRVMVPFGAGNRGRQGIILSDMPFLRRLKRENRLECRPRIRICLLLSCIFSAGLPTSPAAEKRCKKFRVLRPKRDRSRQARIPRRTSIRVRTRINRRIFGFYA